MRKLLATATLAADTGVSDAKPTLGHRACLNCGSSFASEWPGHRICGNCKKSQVWRTAVDSGRSGKS
jgi:ribosomal protein S27AE